MNSLSRPEIFELARRGAVVRWHPSRRLEALRTEGSQIFARRLTRQGFREHLLQHQPGYVYHCEEVDKNTLVSIGDLLR